jgi:signal transduction histidine kinase
MRLFFRKSPLSIKLMLIGIIPLIFLIYLSYELYKEKTQRINLIGDYIEQIHESANIANLIDELQKERRRTYQYVLKKKGYNDIILQRPHTDTAIKRLERSKSLSISNFTRYTFLDNLESVRIAVDSAKNYPASAVMQYYTNAIFRLNTLNSTPASNTYLQSVYQDLIAQKILSDMITMLGIIRSNIYNALYTRQYMVETLLGSAGSHDVYNTYEKEFLLKASPASVALYKKQKDTSSLNRTTSYIDTLFKTFKFDTTYTAETWWDVSTQGARILKKQQLDLWSRVEAKMNNIYQDEKSKKNKTLAFLIVAIILVIIFVTSIFRTINQMLVELKVAAEKIAKGDTGLQIRDMPHDAMGSLAHSILEIDKNNVQLADAASAIGKGNFDITIRPRSTDDLLGNSIEQMKEDLHELTMQKDKLQKDTLDLMHKKDDFLSTASHELKTPVTSLKAYTQLLQMDSKESGDTKSEMMLQRMDAQIDKLTFLITDLLDTSKINNGKLIYKKNVFKLNDLIAESVNKMKGVVTSHEIIIEKNFSADVYGDRERIAQVLNNLLTNAIKYCPDCKKLIVNSEENGENVIFSVQDFGEGIPENEYDKIFGRFYRISGNNLHTYPGLGLGLYISKEIIEKHHGKIWLESELGKGTTFYFSLPIYEG